MGLLEQQNFLAKLYTDKNFCDAFSAEPFEIGRKSDLTDSQIKEILEILPDEILGFAESLLNKRLREVERLLPLTKKILVEDFDRNFQEFAHTFTSLNVKKHLEDSIEFARFLQRKSLEPIWLNDVIKYEQAKLEFNGYDKKVKIIKFDFDLRNIHKLNIAIETEIVRRKTLAVWFKIRNYNKHIII